MIKKSFEVILTEIAKNKYVSYFYCGVNIIQLNDTFNRIFPDGEIFNSDLFFFWLNYGGGEIYETESFLYPLENVSKENLVNVNRDLWSKGLDKKYLVFYMGAFGYGVYNSSDRGLYLLDESNFAIHSKLVSLEQLLFVIYQEFKDRY